MYHYFFCQIGEEELGCGDRTGPEVQVSRDITFRELSDGRTNRARVNKKSLHFAWYVNTHEDVGGFLVTVQNITTGEKLKQVTLPYTVRYHEFSDITSGKHYVCIGGLDSMGKPRTLQTGQCQELSAGDAARGPVSQCTIIIAALLLLALTKNSL